MFDIGGLELLVISIVTLLVVGPKDLPRLLRTVGHWVGKARGAARHFRTGVDAMIREAELAEMQKKWEADNAAIMRAHPAPAATPAAETGETETPPPAPNPAAPPAT